MNITKYWWLHLHFNDVCEITEILWNFSGQSVSVKPTDANPRELNLFEYKERNYETNDKEMVCYLQNL